MLTVASWVGEFARGVLAPLTPLILNEQL
jgi:hypothetical protein